MDSGYDYSKRLFREYLNYPPSNELRLYEDRRRRELLELKIMAWMDDYGEDFLVKQYKEITKNYWKGAKETAKENLNKFLREQKV